MTIEPALTDISKTVLAKRYLIRNEEQEVVETPAGLFKRVADAIASIEAVEVRDSWAQTFYAMMAKCDFQPNTPCLVNAGRPDGTGQLSACFVVRVPDSMDGIFKALHQMAMIFKSGGGVGYSFSELRPSGDFVKSSMGIASGPCSFMQIFNFATEHIKQGGVRRGANMGVLSVDHPDILDFIKLKQDPTKMQNFNVSVAITDAFMFALETDGLYDLIHPTTGDVVGQLLAREVWQAIVHGAWKIGDPGLWFSDRTNALDPLSEALGAIKSTNPCGEVPLRPDDACCLGSINLANYYVERSTPTEIANVSMRHGTIDFDRLKHTVHTATRFLDNMLSLNKYPNERIADVTSKCRKIGLGVMGWADLLIQLGIPYGSIEARRIGDTVMKMINTWTIDASEALAEERGAFHHWPVSSWAKQGLKPRRHSTSTVIAPTGTISIIAGCSSSIEPLFGLSMTRDQAGVIMHEVHPLVEKIARREGFWSDELAEIVRQTGSLATAPGVPDHWREVFMIANELDMHSHIAMQAAFQAHTQDAVSKTINLHKSATEADVEKAYMLAWQLGCKGITVYRDGCRDNQVLTAGVAADATATTAREAKSEGGVPTLAQHSVFPPAHPTSLGDVWIGETQPVFTRLTSPGSTMPPITVTPVPDPKRRRVPADGRRKGETLSRSTPFGTAHVTINEHPDDNEPFEVFVRLGKSGAEVMAWSEAVGRVMSYTLSMPSVVSPKARLEEIANQLSGIGGSDTWGMGADRVVSAPDAIAKTILTYLGKIQDGTNAPAYTKTAATVATQIKDLCPECGQATFTFTQRCGLCTSCGYSKC